MLIAAGLFTFLKWVSIAVLAVCGIWIRLSGFRRNAVIAGLVAFVVGFGPVAISRHVIVATESDGHVEAASKRLFGSDTYAFSDGPSALLPSGSGVLVVNDTDRELSLVTVTYGTSFSTPPDIDIPPMTVGSGTSRDEIDYVGPLDIPPRSISVKKKYSFGGERRLWLTW